MDSKKKNSGTKFKAVDLDVSVNVSQSSPIKEFGKLLIGFSFLIAFLFFISGAIVNIIVPLIPPELEAKIWNFDNIENPSLANTPHQARLDRVFAKIPEKTLSKLPNYPYRLIAIKNHTVNALALPGGKIIVFSGLIDLVKSDDELLFVIAHELGHFASRDHLHSLGREFLFSLFKAFLGTMPSLGDQTQMLLAKGYSREQEIEADSWGYQILKDSGGSTSEAINFFELLQKKDGVHGQFDKITNGLMRTHPYPEERALRLKNIEER